MTSDFHRPRRRRPHVPLIQPDSVSWIMDTHTLPCETSSTAEKPNNYFTRRLRTAHDYFNTCESVLSSLKKPLGLPFIPPRQKHAPCHTYLPRKRGPWMRRRGQLYCSIRRGRREGGGYVFRLEPGRKGCQVCANLTWQHSSLVVLTDGGEDRGVCFLVEAPHFHHLYCLFRFFHWIYIFILQSRR